MTLEEKKKDLYEKLCEEYNMWSELLKVIDEVIVDANQSELESIYLIQQGILNKMMQPNPQLVPPPEFYDVSPDEKDNLGEVELKSEILEELNPLFANLIELDSLSDKIEYVLARYPELTKSKYIDLIKTAIFNETRDYCMRNGAGNNSIKLLLISRTLYPSIKKDDGH